MFVANRLYQLLIFVVLIFGVRNEVMLSLSSGMGYIQEKPVMIPYTWGSIPGIALTLYGMNYFNTSITFCDEEDNIIFVYLGMKRNIHYSITIATLETGFRIFEYGEEIYFQESAINDTAKVYISEAGLSHAIVYKDEPLWAFYDNDYILGSNYLINGGIKIPTTYNLTLEKDYKMQFNDYLMFAGELEKNTTKVRVTLTGKENYILDLTMSLIEEPFLTISTMQNGEEIYMDTSDRMNVLEKPRFTLHLVCEQRGWRIYINGLEMHFFYHRLPPQTVQAALLQGNYWKVKKFIQRYTNQEQ